MLLPNAIDVYESQKIIRISYAKNVRSSIFTMKGDRMLNLDIVETETTLTYNLGCEIRDGSIYEIKWVIDKNTNIGKEIRISPEDNIEILREKNLKKVREGCYTDWSNYYYDKNGNFVQGIR